MALLIKRVLKGLTPWFDADRTPTLHVTPQKIVLGVRPGHEASDRPPVRIFLGSERNQFRAERVFIWSVEKWRDPGRVYEIHLLKGLAGFTGRFWLTGFTNYRFAVPHYCGYQGRAIYNDVDQVYLRDPAELFDQDMRQAGFLAINDRDTSVMLLDCARMGAAWSEPAIFRHTRKQLEAAARSRNLWGPMDAGWNARDAEYQPGQSALVHFTTLHTQPWRPFPNSFVYFDNPTGPLWHDLEREADDAGFLPLPATRPTGDGPAALDGLTSGTSRRGDVDWLEQVPDGDLPWVLARLFERNATLEAVIDEPWLITPDRPRRSGYFWLQQFQRAGTLHPGVRWHLRRKRGWRWQHFHGGPVPDGPIRILAHRKPGHTNQALSLANGLAKATGRPVEQVTVPGGDTGYLLRRAFGLPLPAVLAGEAPVLVASGWLPTCYARWVSRRQGSRPVLVLLGRKAGRPPDHGGVVVDCRHFGLPPHPNLIHTVLPLNAPPRGSVDASPWRAWLDAPRRVAVLVGGQSRSHRLRQADAEALAHGAMAWARRRDAALLVVTSRRTARRIATLQQTVGSAGQVYRWQANDPANPYALALEHADALMVTGESESMLADALHSGIPVAIWRLPERSGLWQRLGSAVADRAARTRYNRRGSIRPQQGLTYLCARLLAARWILPGRNLNQLHDDLLLNGAASLPGDDNLPARRLEPEVQQVAATIARRLHLVATKAAVTSAAGAERHGATRLSEGAPEGAARG
jgi:uncharacterized protein